MILGSSIQYSFHGTIKAICSNIEVVVTGLAPSWSVLKASKCDLVASFIFARLLTFVPSSKEVSLTLFLSILALACLWKKEVLPYFYARISATDCVIKPRHFLLRYENFVEILENHTFCLLMLAANNFFFHSFLQGFQLAFKMRLFNFWRCICVLRPLFES